MFGFCVKVCDQMCFLLVNLGVQKGFSFVGLCSVCIHVYLGCRVVLGVTGLKD